MNPKLREISEKLQNRQIIAIDTRTSREFSSKHIPGSVSAPYSSWGWGNAVADWINGQEIPVLIISGNQVVSGKAIEELKKFKIEAESVIADGLKEWVEDGLPVASLVEIEPEDLNSHREEWDVIDVREPYELNYGMIEGARNVPMSEVQNLINTLDRNRKYAVVCAHGNRSEAAALFLSDNGFNSATVVGGMANWISRSLPVVYPE